MIQELFFTPYSQSRSRNQMNTSVTLRYDTKTEQLQLVDVFGKVKNISIDTTPDMEPEDLTGLITVDYIKELGFATAEETAKKIPSIDTGYGLGFTVSNDAVNPVYKVYLKKSVITGVIVEQVTPQYVRPFFSAGSGISINDGKIGVDYDYLAAQVDDILSEKGYVTQDNDTLYHADEQTLTLTVTPVEPTPEDPTASGVTNTFSINQEWLSGFVTSFLEETDVIPLSAGEGIGIENIVIDEHETNVISLTAHIPSGLSDFDAEDTTSVISSLGFIQGLDVPTYTAGEGIAISDEKEVSLTAHIPTGILDTWTAEQNIADIASLGFVLSSVDQDTKYYAGIGISSSIEPNNNQNLFNIDQEWLSTFVQSFGFLTDESDTTYVGSDSIQITGENNSISVKNSWLTETIAPLIVTNLTTDNSKNAVKSYIDVNYISGLGFVLTNEQKDTTYDNGAGLDLTSTTFSVNTDWLNNQISTFVSDNITSAWLSGTGIAISDTTCLSGIGIIIEEDPNQDPVHKTQTVNLNITFLSTWLDRYNFDHGIMSRHDVSAGSGLGIVVDDNNKIDTIVLTAAIPSSLATLDSVSANTNYISSLGFVLAGDDKDTKYGVVANGGLTVDTDHNFAIDTNWMDNRVSSFITSSALPTKVSELNNDKSFVTQAELEAVKLNLMQQFANLTLVVDIDGDVNTPTQNVYVETSEPVTNNTTFTGKNITVTKLNNSDSYVKFTSTGDVSISKLNSSGNLDKETNGNAQIIINTPERVSITDSTLAQTGYNAIEIGLNPSIEPPKSVLIDGVKFNGALSNNAISIFGTADDAVVTISNCDFTQVSNTLRISNRTNTKVTINLINCTFGTWESGEYGGPILCQDYTSSSAAEVESANRFSPDKVTINMINCRHNGTPITFDDPVDVCGTGDANQLLYVYAKVAGGLIAYDAAKFPSFSAK